MANLLPKNYKKKINQEYLLRLVGTSLSFLGVTFVLLTLFSIPSLLLSSAKLEITKERLESITSYVEETQKAGISDSVIFANQKIDIVSGSEKVNLTKLLHFVLDKKNQKIKIEAIVVRSAGEQGRSIFISGLAKDRASLTDLQKSLETVADFSEVILPISNFAKNTDIDFSMEIKINDNIPE